MRKSPLAAAPQILAGCVTLLAAVTVAQAQEVPAPLAPPAPAMEEVAPGKFRIGKLILEKETKSVTFPGKVNMDKGLLEYLLTGPKGSTHETLLVTEIAPSDLHMAMLLLGAKGAGLRAPGPDDKPPEQITDEYLKTAPQPAGDKIFISVKWKKEGKETITPVEDWLQNTETAKPAERGPWIYTGSMFVGEKFLAQTEQSFAALVTYPPALINNPRKGNTNDAVWEVNEKAVAPVDTPLEITIRLDPAPPAKP